MNRVRGDAGGTAVGLTAVRKVHGEPPRAVAALADVSLWFARGSFTAVMGPSGSGKSTLLHCAAGLDRPSDGSVVVDGQPLDALDETSLTKLRRDRVGFIFQEYNLLPALTVAQNVALPLELAGRSTDAGRLAEVLALVGLADRYEHRPAELSGGQQQRVALARALITEPAVLFADEPTGALDTRTAREVLELLRGAVSSVRQTVIMVTHDPVAASYADRVVFLADGHIAGELWQPTADAVAERLAHLGEREPRVGQNGGRA